VRIDPHLCGRYIRPPSSEVKSRRLNTPEHGRALEVHTPVLLPVLPPAASHDQL
jgi:hypothetical protein